ESAGFACWWFGVRRCRISQLSLLRRAFAPDKFAREARPLRRRAGRVVSADARRRDRDKHRLVLARRLRGRGEIRAGLAVRARNRRPSSRCAETGISGERARDALEVPASPETFLRSRAPPAAPDPTSRMH